MPNPRPRVVQFGGSFAPPITAAKLEEYKRAANLAGEQVGEVMQKLIKMVEVFQETPVSSLPGQLSPVGLGLMVPLEEAEIKRIWEYVPWDYECDAYQILFDRIPPESPVRNPAFHLLWYAKELLIDREPMTNDHL